MRIPRVILGLALLGSLVAGLLVHAPRARAAEACFAETGFCVRGAFLDYWLAHGGLAINGFPLSDEFTEVLEDGKPYTVQYCERARLEWHPEIADPQYRVLLGQFGRRVLREAYAVDRKAYPGAVAPAQPIAGQAYFAET